jgi:hypothetical protein
MLKPVYFPFTHLGDRAAAALQAQFDSILLLRPYAEELPPGMRELEGRGFLEVLTPALGDEAGGVAAVGEFLEWARRHAGGVGPTGAFWQAHLAGDPVGGDRSAFQLASQIRRRSLPDERLAAADPLPAAQLFLRLAQELDEQDEEVLRDLARCQTHQAELMEALAGRPRVSSPGPVGADGLPPTGHEEHRIAERLSAWARLFPACFRPSPVLVTTSAAVLELLVEASEAVRRLPTAKTGPDRSSGGAGRAADGGAGGLGGGARGAHRLPSPGRTRGACGSRPGGPARLPFSQHPHPPPLAPVRGFGFQSGNDGREFPILEAHHRGSGAAR